MSIASGIEATESTIVISAASSKSGPYCQSSRQPCGAAIAETRNGSPVQPVEHALGIVPDAVFLIEPPESPRVDQARQGPVERVAEAPRRPCGR